MVKVVRGLIPVLLVLNWMCAGGFALIVWPASSPNPH
jgi:hypothetical protein